MFDFIIELKGHWVLICNMFFLSLALELVFYQYLVFLVNISRAYTGDSRLIRLSIIVMEISMWIRLLGDSH